jgi:hypothetical protein
MDILEWVNTYSGALTFFATLILVIITAVYVKFTQSMMDSAKAQFISQQNPVIGIKVNDMYLGCISESYLQFNIDFTLTNLGNAPALEVLIDSEIKSNFFHFKGENVIPSRWVSTIPFIRVGEELYSDPQVKNAPFFSQSFNSDVFEIMDKGFKKEQKLNQKRIEKNHEPEYRSNIFLIDVYCKNSFNHFFKSHFETYLILGEKFPDYIEVKPYFEPAQKFYSRPISEDDFKEETASRKLKREKLKI